jgi:hypothetical protein
MQTTKLRVIRDSEALGLDEGTMVDVVAEYGDKMDLECSRLGLTIAGVSKNHPDLSTFGSAARSDALRLDGDDGGITNEQIEQLRNVAGLAGLHSIVTDTFTAMCLGKSDMFHWPITAKERIEARLRCVAAYAVLVGQSHGQY